MAWWSGWYGEWFADWFSGDETSTGVDKNTDTPLERTRFVPAKKDPFVKAVKREVFAATAVREIEAHEDDAKMEKFDPKDPDERDDFKLNWTRRLAPIDDTVYESAWEIVTDMSGDTNPLAVFDDDIMTGAKATRVWLEGGTSGNTYKLENTIVTVGGRTLQDTISIKVKDK